MELAVGLAPGAVEQLVLGGGTLGIRKRRLTTGYHLMFLVSCSQDLTATLSHNRAKHRSRMCCI